jgi:hypothetical protein
MDAGYYSVEVVYRKWSDVNHGFDLKYKGPDTNDIEKEIPGFYYTG